jgi:hypothetical protein
MRKSRHNLYQWILLGVLAINLFFHLFVYLQETVAVKDACWENPWYGLFVSVLSNGFLVVLLMLHYYEVGRKKGIKEMADMMLVDPDDYLDFDERIMVTEKHTTGNKRRTHAVPLKYEEGGDETKNNS